MAQHRSTRLLALGLLFVVCAGCLGNPRRTELLQARLREQETVLSQYETELTRVRSQLAVAQREQAILRNRIASSGEPAPAMEATQAIAAADGLKFNTWLTAGRNQDSSPGDERFHAIVYPHDASGDLVKVVGTLKLEAIDLSLPEGERSLGKWEFTPDEALELWHSGFLSAGFRFDYEWDKPPQGKEIILRASLETPDGRQLAANHSMKIDPPHKLNLDQIDAKPIPVPVDEPAISAATEAAADDLQQNQTSVSGTSETTPQTSPESAAESRVAPAESPTPPARDLRPEPVLDLFELPAEEPGRATISPISFEKPASQPPLTTQPTAPRPFPNQLQTSDNWTEATIPTLR